MTRPPDTDNGTAHTEGRDASGEDPAAEAKRHLAGLPKHMAEIVEYLFGLKDGNQHSLQETGDQFGISRQRVFQIRKAAIRRMRSAAK